MFNKKGPYLFLFDSGNLDEFTISTNTAAEWGLEKEADKTNILFMDRPLNINVKTKDIIYDGAINYAFIQQSIYIIDLRKKEVWARHGSSKNIE